jgi:hypothetical protein
VGFLLGACGGGETKYVTVTSQSSKTTEDQATTKSSPVRRFDSFRSPSGNIGCYMDDESVRCDIRERSWKSPPKPPNCDVDYGYGISVGTTGLADLICAGDTALNPKATALQYGERNVVGDFSCGSEQAGMTCRNTRTGSGFFLSRERYQLF